MSEADDLKRSSKSANELLPEIWEIAHDVHQGGCAMLMYISSLRASLKAEGESESLEVLQKMEECAKERFIDYPRDIMRLSFTEDVAL